MRPPYGVSQEYKKWKEEAKDVDGKLDMTMLTYYGLLMAISYMICANTPIKCRMCGFPMVLTSVLGLLFFQRISFFLRKFTRLHAKKIDNAGIANYKVTYRRAWMKNHIFFARIYIAMLIVLTIVVISQCPLMYCDDGGDDAQVVAHLVNTTASDHQEFDGLSSDSRELMNAIGVLRIDRIYREGDIAGDHMARVGLNLTR